MRFALQVALLGGSLMLAGCPSNGSTGLPDLAYLPPSPDGGSIAQPCSLPGSFHMTANGLAVVPGGRATPDLRFMRIPVGFCMHYFGHVGNARQLRFAPGGELFVASPTTATTGGGPSGQAAIVILADDDQDGYADAPLTFLSGLPSTQGLLFTGSDFYYQDGTRIMRMPYKAGDRRPSASATVFADITIYQSSLHWPKTLDIADDGSIYVGNGGDQDEACVVPHPFHGGILKIDGVNLGGTPIAHGLRNPIAVRCLHGHNTCFALELAKDYSATMGGREKMIPIRPGDDWGFPCCATQNLPYPDVPPTDCSKMTPESVSFIIGDTPFGLDFEGGRWPDIWNGRAFVALHGAYGNFAGARVVGIAMDPTTGLPLPATDRPGPPGGAMADFMTGWDDGTASHGRPAAVAFARDGRLFLANDATGDIIWIAPIGM